jgi:hypothetical protein
MIGGVGVLHAPSRRAASARAGGQYPGASPCEQASAAFVRATPCRQSTPEPAHPVPAKVTDCPEPKTGAAAVSNRTAGKADTGAFGGSPLENGFACTIPQRMEKRP